MKNAIVLLTILLYSCGSTDSNEILVSNYGYAQGTTYNISYMSPNAESYQTGIDSILHVVDLSMSTYIDSSIISKINRNESFETDTLFLRVLNTAIRIAEETEGAFDPTIAPLVNYWGFGFKEIKEKNQAKLSELSEAVGYHKVSVLEGKIVKKNENTQLDFNAIAQGFTVDLVGEYLQKEGIKNYMVEIGGEVKCKGLNADAKLWRIGVDKASETIQEDRFQAIIEVNNKSVASSGNYRKFKTDQVTGKKYAHTIDPKTGKSVQTNLLGVTIVMESCMQADAYATAFMVMGIEASKSFLEKRNDIEALFVYTDSKGNWQHYQTKGFEEITIYNSN
tara:strand:- start:157 stop:1164 length:1008 start_codon:yes stop_codon:yes gene_type:complete